MFSYVLYLFMIINLHGSNQVELNMTANKIRCDEDMYIIFDELFTGNIIKTSVNSKPKTFNISEDDFGICAEKGDVIEFYSNVSTNIPITYINSTENIQIAGGNKKVKLRNTNFKTKEDIEIIGFQNNGVDFFDGGDTKVKYHSENLKTATIINLPFIAEFCINVPDSYRNISAKISYDTNKTILSLSNGSESLIKHINSYKENGIFIGLTSVALLVLFVVMFFFERAKNTANALYKHILNTFITLFLAPVSVSVNSYTTTQQLIMALFEACIILAFKVFFVLFCKLTIDHDKLNLFVYGSVEKGILLYFSLVSQALQVLILVLGKHVGPRLAEDLLLCVLSIVYSLIDFYSKKNSELLSISFFIQLFTGIDNIAIVLYDLFFK